MTERIREFDGAVVAATRGMYARLGDRPGFDAHLHSDITIWESDEAGPLMDLAGLDALRDRRGSASDDATPPRLRVEDPVVDRWGEQVAVIRYLLRAEVDGAVTTFRVTDVLTNDNVGSVDDAGGSDASSPWRIVHHHAEHLTDAATDTPGTES